ncbi:hypothetical protein Ahy_A01g002366 isoform C [Arachis hypogaea]|uniref:Uncharacterized protein n=1 Tax=Arachis hypogaea TaxID=3818 RepID=A0A445EQX1_ARAHY|nr:hypothetical protein Ahy_A01g002366 isoform C [Arachis hypogaea]
MIKPGNVAGCKMVPKDVIAELWEYYHKKKIEEDKVPPREAPKNRVSMLGNLTSIYQNTLEAAINDINNSFGKGSFTSWAMLGELYETCPSGCLTLDCALGGGLPKGAKRRQK